MPFSGPKIYRKATANAKPYFLCTEALQLLPCDKKIFGQRKLHLLFSVDLKHRVNLSPQVGSNHHFKVLKSHNTYGVRAKNLTSLILCSFLEKDSGIRCIATIPSIL